MAKGQNISKTGHPAVRGVTKERGVYISLVCAVRLMSCTLLPAFWGIPTDHGLSMSTGCQETHWTKNEGSDNSQMHTTSVFLCSWLKYLSSEILSSTFPKTSWGALSCVNYYLIQFNFTLQPVNALVYYTALCNVLGVLLWLLCLHLYLIRTAIPFTFL